jgi:hypothetical protein
MVVEAEQVGAEPMSSVARRRRQRLTPRFSDGEHELVCAAAAAAGLAVNAWMAEVAVRVARSAVAPLPADWREVLAELIATRGQVRRVGVLPNQIAPDRRARACHWDGAGGGGAAGRDGRPGGAASGRADRPGGPAAAVTARR